MNRPDFEKVRNDLGSLCEGHSSAFFAKSWPQYELDGLVTMAISGKQVRLPLWHGVSKDHPRGAEID